MSKEAQNEAIIRQLYTELHKFGNNGDFDKAIKVANRSEFLISLVFFSSDVDISFQSLELLPMRRRPCNAK